MEITPSSLRGLRTTFSTIFRNALSEAAVWHPKLAMTVPSSSSQNDYGWMAALPKMREWLGERVVHNLQAQSYAIKNKTWELTIGVKREDIEDDNLGIYQPIVAELGRVARKQPDDLIVDLLKNGQARLGYDGQNFFDTDHPTGVGGSGSQQNYWASGKALSIDNYFDVRAKMASFKGESGDPIGVTPNLLVVPPALEKTGKTILTAENDAAGATNIARGTAELLVIPELAGQDTTWYLLDTTRAIKPFVLQTRRGVELVAKTNPDDDNVFERNEYLYGASTRNNAGYALWFLAAKAVG